MLALLVVGTAEAQKRRLPVRTEEIPDTESGRPAASAERPTFKGRLLIFGPPSLPVTPPPEHVKPVPEAEQAKPAPAPAPIAAPAPKLEPAPAPVVTPVPAPSAPMAAPIAPAPAPAPVAQPKPEPAPPTAKPAPVIAPAPVAAPTPPPAPVAAPTPPPAAPSAPPVVAAPAPKPEPAPVVAAPPPPAPAIAAPAPREPIVREPVVRVEPARPAPEPAKPAAAPRQEVALAVPSAGALPSPAAPVPIEMKLIESIFTCLAPGLPQDWRRAWVEITDQGSGKEKAAKFRFTNLRGDDEGEPLVPCNAQELTRRIVGLNEKLPPERRAWSRALLVIESDGEYELSYEYPK